LKNPFDSGHNTPPGPAVEGSMAVPWADIKPNGKFQGRLKIFLAFSKQLS
jgi:hypothetical protein